jgi:putative spermidine/putrescine transport system ATP-binding protein
MDPSRGVAISLRGLRKEFGHGSAAVTAVDGVTLDVLDGEFLTLLGPSGSGKTTVLRMIAGFVYLPQRLSSDAAGGGRI